MDYLDDFLVGPQSDEYDDDEFWFWSDFQDLGMGIPDPEWDRRCRGLEKLMLDN